MIINRLPARILMVNSKYQISVTKNDRINPEHTKKLDTNSGTCSPNLFIKIPLAAPKIFKIS